MRHRQMALSRVFALDEAVPAAVAIGSDASVSVANAGPW